VRLLTNNPLKVSALTAHGVLVHERIPLLTALNVFNEGYMQTKQEKMGHMLPPLERRVKAA
jgi:GTP cyclohydrolase II